MAQSLDDAGYLTRVGTEELLDEPGGGRLAVRLVVLVANREPDGHRQGGDASEPECPEAVNPTGPRHHPALGAGPVLAAGQGADVGPFQGGGEVTVLRLCFPERGTLGQAQFGAAPAGLTLLASQPVAERVDEVVVGELVVAAAAARGRSLAGSAFGVGGGHQPQLGVEDAEEVVEVAGPVGIAGGVAQFLGRLHQALDVGAALGQQGFQDSLRGLLVEAVLGGRGGGAEGLFKEGHADPLRPADGAERGRGPGLPLDHLGEQGEADGDDLAVVREALNRLVEEGVLVGGKVAGLFGQDSVSPAERREHLASVEGIEKVYGGGVVSLDEANFQVSHETGGRHPEVVADHDDRLEVLTVAMAQGRDQLGVGLRPPGEEPLLELVEHEQHLLPGTQRLPPP